MYVLINNESFGPGGVILVREGFIGKDFKIDKHI